MKINEFISDKKPLILFYIILMSFISISIYVYNQISISFYNIIYINLVSFIIFIIYLVISYLRENEYFNSLNFSINNEQEDIIESLPKPKTYSQKLNDALFRKINKEFNDKFDKLNEQIKQNEEFVTSWVHEIKTPISVCRLILESSSEKEVYEVIDNIEDEINKIDNYVEQSLYYSRINSFANDYFISEINLNSIIKNVIKKNAKTFINKRISVDMDEDLDLQVKTDKKWLDFIISQVIANSLKYTKECGKIKIKFEYLDKEKKLIIEDNGIGIKKEDLDRVFDKGFTGFNGREGYKSTGMGLYLAKSLARKLGHDITIESVYGKYTKVKIHFFKNNTYLNF